MYDCLKHDTDCNTSRLKDGRIKTNQHMYVIAFIIQLSGTLFIRFQRDTDISLRTRDINDQFIFCTSATSKQIPSLRRDVLWYTNVRLSVRLSVHLSVRLSVHLSVRLSICPSVRQNRLQFDE
jgi:hypothetical protein